MLMLEEVYNETVATFNISGSPPLILPRTLRIRLLVYMM